MGKNKLAQVFHFDLYGKREDKYNFLNENSLESIDWTELHPQAPNFFFVPKDFETFSEYEKGFKVNELFPVTNVGIVTSRDAFVIDSDKKKITERINDFFNLTKEEILLKYNLRENKGWKIDDVKQKAKCFDEKYITPISYRPFDNQYIYYDHRFIERSRNEVMQHFLNGENVGLAIGRQGQVTGSDVWDIVSITNKILDFNYYRRGGELIFPLYLYPETNGQQSFEQKNERVPNLNMEIVNKIAKNLGLSFVPEKENSNKSIAPIDILDYIYAILHSPSYREKYKEFLKIDFPRIPYPIQENKFWQLVQLGGELRKIHLLEGQVVENYITQYPIDGDNVVGKIHYEGKKVFINYSETPPLGVGGLQYFDNVPLIAWNFYIGGYQPAQKWLKDRRGRTLEFDDILHYQKIIVALSETDRLMKKIDEIGFE